MTIHCYFYTDLTSTYLADRRHYSKKEKSTIGEEKVEITGPDSATQQAVHDIPPRNRWNVFGSAQTDTPSTSIIEKKGGEKR